MTMQLKIHGFELSRRCFVLSKFLPSAAIVLFSTVGSSAQLTEYYVPTTPPVDLVFRAFDPARTPIDERWLLARLAAALQAHSAKQLKSAGEATTELSGLRTRLDQDSSRIVFEYVHVARNKFGEEWGQTLTIPVSYRIERASEVITIRLWPPQTADFATHKTPAVFFLPTPKLGPIKDLFDDFSAILHDAPSLGLRQSFLLGGAEEAGVSPEPCIAIFDRLLGRYAYTKDEERVFDPMHDDVFLYRTAQDSVALKIRAVPYRGGSKVFYEAWVPFELHADGTVSGYDLPLALESEVQRILEDLPPRELKGGLDDIHRQASSRN
jgi:hypothetical protein